MGLSNSISHYADIKPVFDKAIELGGGLYEFETRGQAVRWRSRAYKFRKLLEQQMYADNPYGQLILVLGNKPEDKTVEIRIGQPMGVFKTPQGKKVKLKKAAALAENPVDTLLEETKKLVAEKGD